MSLKTIKETSLSFKTTFVLLGIGVQNEFLSIIVKI